MRGCYFSFGDARQCHHCHTYHCLSDEQLELIKIYDQITYRHHFKGIRRVIVYVLLKIAKAIGE